MACSTVSTRVFGILGNQPVPLRDESIPRRSQKKERDSQNDALRRRYKASQTEGERASPTHALQICTSKAERKRDAVRSNEGKKKNRLGQVKKGERMLG